MLKKSILTLLLAFFGIAWTGIPIKWFGVVTPGGTIPLPAWIEWLGIEHPLLWILAIGLLLGYWLIPGVIEIIEREKEYERFYSEFRSQDMGFNRSRFFMYLSRAYEEWKKDKHNLEDTLDKQIDKTAFPRWLPVLNGELLDVIDREFGHNPPPMWSFAWDLYRQIDSFLKKRTGTTLLLPEEAEILHDMRQRLTYFWEDAGFVIFRERKLRLRKIKRHINSDERFLMPLLYLSLALHKANQQKGQGSKHFYYLAAIHFGAQNYGFLEEWIKRPLSKE